MLDYYKSSEVEYISLTEVFEKSFPFYLSVGMTYDLYWREDPTIVKYYYEAYKQEMKEKMKFTDWKLWRQGVYIYEALCDVAPILHAFAKKGTKPLPYSKKPYGFDEEEMTEEEKEKQLEAEKLKAKIHFNQLFRALERRFNKGGGPNGK